MGSWFLSGTLSNNLSTSTMPTPESQDLPRNGFCLPGTDRGRVMRVDKGLTSRFKDGLIMSLLVSEQNLDGENPPKAETKKKNTVLTMIFIKLP